MERRERLIKRRKNDKENKKRREEEKRVRERLRNDFLIAHLDKVTTQYL